jgi:hypothetical protein
MVYGSFFIEILIVTVHYFIPIVMNLKIKIFKKRELFRGFLSNLELR